jgi:iron complex outermembrane receptor protein
MDGKTVVPNPLYNLAYPSTGASYNRVFNILSGYFPALAANKGAPIAFRWRSLPLGNRGFTTTTDTFRTMVGAEGPLGFLSQWDHRAGASPRREQGQVGPDERLRLHGSVRGVDRHGGGRSVLLHANPRGDGGDRQGPRQRRRALRWHLSHGRSRSLGVRPSVTKLPAGQMQAAVGLDWRQESFFFPGRHAPRTSARRTP